MRENVVMVDWRPPNRRFEPKNEKKSYGNVCLWEVSLVTIGTKKCLLREDTSNEQEMYI